MLAATNKNIKVYLLINNVFSELAAVIGEITPVTVTQQKTYQDNEDWYKTAHATDKDLSTESAAEPDNGEVWLKLQFDKTYFIHKIIIYQFFFTNWYTTDKWCVQSEGNYQECKDGHNNVDIAVHQGDELQATCGTLQLTYALNQADQIYTFICSTDGDTVLLSKTADHLSVYEIVVTSTGNFTGVNTICYINTLQLACPPLKMTLRSRVLFQNYTNEA